MTRNNTDEMPPQLKGTSNGIATPIAGCGSGGGRHSTAQLEVPDNMILLPQSVYSQKLKMRSRTCAGIVSYRWLIHLWYALVHRRVAAGVHDVAFAGV